MGTGRVDTVFISETDQFLFAQGTHYDIYKKLGALPFVEEGVDGYFFATWAPNAQAVNVVGDFNGWNEWANPCEKIGPGGIWTTFIPDVTPGQYYKFLITTADGNMIYKADPYANYAELRPGTASIVTDLGGFAWKDGKWMEERDKKDMRKEPVAIYECHIGSFMKHPDGTEDGFYTYRQFADRKMSRAGKKLDAMGDVDAYRQYAQEQDGLWEKFQGREILKDLANNPGAGGIASAGAGLGMGIAAGSMVGDIAKSVFSTVQQPQQGQQPIQQSAATNRFGVGGNNTATDPSDEMMNKLTKLKQMLDLGVITQAEFDETKKQIMAKMFGL